MTANQIENAFYDAYGPRWVSTIYAPVNEYKVLLELAPQFQADPAALSLLYFKTQRPAGSIPLDTLATIEAGDRAADRQPLRPAAGGDDLVRPGAGRLARRRVSTQCQRGRATRRCPTAVSGQFQGAAKAFESSLANLAVLLLIAIAGRLHRARHSVRELHPPADDPVRPAVGRLRRAGHADPLPHGPEHLRLRRHDHADRHRREERDHADRLRARGASAAA